MRVTAIIRGIGYIQRDPTDKTYYLYVTNEERLKEIKDHLIPRKTPYDPKRKRVYVGFKKLGNGYSRIVFQLTQKTCLKIDRFQFKKVDDSRHLAYQNENEYHNSLNYCTIPEIRKYICKVTAKSKNSFFMLEQEYAKGYKPSNKIDSYYDVRPRIERLEHLLARKTGYSGNCDFNPTNVLVKQHKGRVDIKVCDIGYIC